MTVTHDSLGSIAIELGKLLEPVQSELVPPQTQAFFAQLGIQLTNAQAAALGPSPYASTAKRFSSTFEVSGCRRRPA